MRKLPIAFLLLTLWPTLALARPKVLLFDVFGTCVDYRGTIVSEGVQMNKENGWSIDWSSFLVDWVDAHVSEIERVRMGELPWMNLDEIHRHGLAERLHRYGGPDPESFSAADLDEIVKIWYRLRPWADTLPGLSRLRENFSVGVLSNGNVALLEQMALNENLPWNYIFSAEQVRHYKPDPETYQLPIQSLHLPPSEIMLVAAHRYDLAAGAESGMMTAFIPRKGEPELKRDRQTKRVDFDFTAHSLVELAEMLEKTYEIASASPQ